MRGSRSESSGRRKRRSSCSLVGFLRAFMGISFTYDMCRWVSPPAHMLGHCCSVATDFGCLRVEKPTELGHRRRRVDRWPPLGVNASKVPYGGTGPGMLGPATKGTTADGHRT